MRLNVPSTGPSRGCEIPSSTDSDGYCANHAARTRPPSDKAGDQMLRRIRTSACVMLKASHTERRARNSTLDRAVVVELKKLPMASAITPTRIFLRVSDSESMSATLSVTNVMRRRPWKR